MLIQSLVPFQHDPVELSKLTVLLGPNNVGKSKTLQDVARLLTHRDAERATAPEGRGHVVEDLRLASPLTREGLLQGVTRRDDDRDSAELEGLGADLRSSCRMIAGAATWSLLRRPVLSVRSVSDSELPLLLNLRVAQLEPTDPSLLEPCAPSNPLEPPNCLLQLLDDARPAVHDLLDDAFDFVFPGQHLRLDRSQRVRLELRVADGFPEPAPDAAALARAWDALAPLTDQGRAQRSFAALALAVLLLEDRLLLIDTPDAYLRAGPARRVGQWLGERLTVQPGQALLVASRVELLEGLLESGGDVSVLRLTRHDEGTRFDRVPVEAVRGAAASPFLTASSGSRCLAADGVVLCADEQDRVILEELLALQPDGEGIVLPAACGVQGVTELAAPFVRAKVPLAVVVGLDLFRSASAVRQLAEACCGELPPGWSALREKLAIRLDDSYDEAGLSQNTQEVEAFLEQFAVGGASPSRVALPATLTDTRRWRELHSHGLRAVPLEVRREVDQVVEEAKLAGVFFLPVGSVRHWFPELESASAWRAEAVLRIRRGDCPAELAAFAGGILNHLRRPHPGRPRPRQEDDQLE